MLNELHNPEISGAISTDASRAAVRVIHTDEELSIARLPYEASDESRPRYRKKPRRSELPAGTVSQL